MPGISYPNIFANIGGNQPASLLDANFNAVPAGITAMPGAWKLTGINDSVTPATKYGLTADVVFVRKSSTNEVISISSGVQLTVDLALAGPIVNGRDQAAAFADNSWVHIYYIWNGTVLALIASATLPGVSAGPTLPSGYTYASYVTSVRLNAVQTLVRQRLAGNFVWYEVDNLGITRVLTNGTAIAFTGISLATLVPPNSTMASVRFEANANTPTIGQVVDAFIRPTGSVLATGVRAVRAEVLVANFDSLVSNTMNVMLNSAQSFDYRLTTAIASGLSIDVIGYYIPNGST